MASTDAATRRIYAASRAYLVTLGDLYRCVIEGAAANPFTHELELSQLERRVNTYTDGWIDQIQAAFLAALEQDSELLPVVDAAVDANDRMLEALAERSITPRTILETKARVNDLVTLTRRLQETRASAGGASPRAQTHGR